MRLIQSLIFSTVFSEGIAMDKKSQVNLMLIASGSGTDAFAIMDAWQKGWIPEVSNIILVSTRAGAKCLEKAAICDVKAVTLVPPSIPFANGQDESVYREAINSLAREYEIDLVFLVGCVIVLPLLGIPMYNIHPADPNLHGGNKMYGLRVHEHVLAAIVDEIERWKKSINETIFTHPTVHEVTAMPDGGPPLLQGSVEIPQELVLDVLEKKHSLQSAAEWLQKLVLPYEWIMLPTAVRMAAAKILAAR